MTLRIAGVRPARRSSPSRCWTRTVRDTPVTSSRRSSLHRQQIRTQDRHHLSVARASNYDWPVPIPCPGGRARGASRHWPCSSRLAITVSMSNGSNRICGNHFTWERAVCHYRRRGPCYGKTIRCRDDAVAPYSSRGPTWYDAYAKPDVVVSGHRLAGFDGRRQLSVDTLWRQCRVHAWCGSQVP